MKEYSQIKLMFHTESFIELALNQKEPEEPLVELLERHEKMSTQYQEFREEYNKVIAQWRKGDSGIEANDIDYDAWEESDPDSFMKYALGDFNGFKSIDMLEYEIDVKICHIISKNNGQRSN